MGWSEYPPYVPVATRRANALREVQKMARKGTKVSPVKIDGRTIASTFWQSLVRQPRILQRLQQPASAWPHVCPQWFCG
jgi:hypothetical protein